MKKIGLMLVVGLLLLGSASPVFAHEGEDHDEMEQENSQSITSEMSSEQSERIKTERESLRAEVKNFREEARSEYKAARERIKTERKEAMLSMRDQMRQKMEAVRNERKTALSDKRLELCEQRQEMINKLVASSAEISSKRLALVQSFENRVTEFYAKQSLTSAEYDAALELVNEKEEAAKQAVEVAKGTQFDCEQANGTNPSGEIKTLHRMKVQALKDYRDSVKQLIQIVKAAYEQKLAERGES